MAENSKSSWKDEFFVIVLSIPLILAFIPGAEGIVDRGFEQLHKAPDWYFYSLGIAISASFGVKGYKQFTEEKVMYTYFVKSIDRVVDGDTIDISIDLGFDLTKKERVRLAGIDTPETRTKNPKEKEMGYEAKEFLEIHLMKASKLTVKTEKDGKFGRMLGWLYKSEEDEISINEIMIDEGYAWSYDGGTKLRNLEDLLAKRDKEKT